MPLDDPKNTMWELDTERVSPDVAEELLRQAELRQEAMFRAALGMDQRAAVLAAGFVAAAGAVAAAGIALGQGQPAIRAAAFVGALLAVVASGFCAWACRPQKFRFPGIMPLNWAKDPAYLEEPLPAIRIARAAELQEHMASNEAKQTRNGRMLSAGMVFAALAPVAAVVTWSAWLAFGLG